MTVRESVIETYFKKQIQDYGGLHFKFKSTVNGVPDQLIAHNGILQLVEIKRPGGKLRADQIEIHEQLKKQGITVHTLDTKSNVDVFINQHVGRVPITKQKRNINGTIEIQDHNLFKINTRKKRTVKKNTLRESKVETYFKKKITSIGGLHFKFKSTINGVPDQLIAYNSKLLLVEIKRPDEELRLNQIDIHNQLHEKGVIVYVIDTYEKVDQWIKDYLLNT